MKAWLAQIPWDFVVYQNASLCAAKGALHKPSSDGYKLSQTLWEQRHLQEMGLMDAVELCQQCHRMAPFCFYNGNTFAAIARSFVSQINIAADKAAAVRSLIGHIVAGVANAEEVEAFRQFSATVTD